MVLLVFVVALQAYGMTTGLDEPKYQGEPISVWIPRLSGSNQSVAIQALKFIGKPAVPELSKALINKESPNPIRWNAAIVLWEIGPDAAGATDALHQAEKDDSNLFVRFCAARALWKVNKEGDPIKKWIREFAADADPRQLQRAAETATEMGADGASSLSDLLDGVKKHPLVGQQDIDEKRSNAFQAVVKAAVAFGDASIPELIAALGESEDQANLVAKMALIQFGPKAVNPLLESLESKNAKTRIQAISVLSSFGEQAAPAMDALRNALGDEVFPVQIAAAIALWNISHNPDWTLPTLKKAVATLNAENMIGVLFFIGQIGPPALACVQDLNKIATGDDLKLAVAASTALWKVAKDPRVPILRQALRQKDWTIATSAMQTLEAIGKAGMREQAKSAIPELISWLPNPLWGSSAVPPLAAMGKDSVDALINLLRSSGSNVARANAAQALGMIGKDAAPAVPILRPLDDVKGKDASIYVAAHQALEKILGAGAWGPDVLIDTLVKQKDESSRLWAMSELSRLGTGAKPAIEFLLSALDDKNDAIRRGASECLSRIGLAAIDPLINTLRAGSSRAVDGAASALGGMKRRTDFDDSSQANETVRDEKLKATMDPLIDRLRDGTARIRESVAVAIVEIGTADPRALAAYVHVLRDSPLSTNKHQAARGFSKFKKAAVQPLIESIDENFKDSYVLTGIAESLEKIGTDASAAVPKLVPLLKSDDPGLRKETIQALAAIGIREDDVNAVTPFVKDPDKYVATYAIMALGKLGPKAISALVPLSEVLDGDDPDLIDDACSALGAMGPPAIGSASKLLALLKRSKNDSVRGAVMSAIIAMKVPSAQALPYFQEVYQGEASVIIKRQALLEALQLVEDGDRRMAILEEVLKDGESYMKNLAILEIGKFGKRAAKVVPQLLAMLNPKEPDLSLMIEVAIEKIGLDARFVPPAIPLLEVDSTDLKIRTINNLAALGDKSANAIPPLRKRLQGDRDPEVRKSVALAVQNIIKERSADEATAEILAHAVKDDPDDSVKANAAYALGWSVRSSPSIAPVLLEMLKNVKSEVRASAAYALGRFGTEPKSAIPMIVPLLQDVDNNVVAQAVDALAAYGDQSVPLVLTFLRGTTLPENRRRGVVTLEAIGRESDITSAIPDLAVLLNDANQDTAIAAASALGKAAPRAAENGNVGLLGPIFQSVPHLRTLQAKYNDPAAFAKYATIPVEKARDRLLLTLAGYVAIPLSAATVSALAFLGSGRLRRAYWRMRNKGWRFDVGECQHHIRVLDDPERDRVTLIIDSRGLAIVPRFAFPKSSLPSDDDDNFRRIRQHVRGAKVLVRADESEFRKPWSRQLGGSWTEDNTAIAGQQCLVTNLGAPEAATRPRLVLAALGCADPHHRDLDSLNGLDREIKTIRKRCKSWGAEILDLPTEIASRDDLLKALVESDIVHVSAHATANCIYLNDGPMDIGCLDETILSNLRCRLLVLSACSLGDLTLPAAFVAPLVERGVNVIAATRPTAAYSTGYFFQSLYDALLPARSAEGIELAESIRAAVDSTRRHYKGDVASWTEGVNSIILYGDPSLHLRLDRVKMS